MTAVRIHGVIYTAVMTMLVAIWALAGGGGGFWPAWPMVTWGAALMIHGGVSAAVCRPRSGYLPARGPGVSDPEPSELTEGGRRWLVVMFVDIVGSTSLNEQMGDVKWHRVLMDHRARVRRCLERAGGVEVANSGDGTLARFSSPEAAVRSAVRLQGEIAAARELSPEVPPVRIGIHAGEALQSDSDVMGNAVNLASRVADEAGPGEVLVTETVADQLSPSLPTIDHGLVTLKGLAQPRHLLTVDWTTALSGG